MFCNADNGLGIRSTRVEYRFRRQSTNLETMGMIPYHELIVKKGCKYMPLVKILIMINN